MADQPVQKAAEQQAGQTLEASEFQNLLQKDFKPKTDEAKSAVQAAVQTLAQQALANTTLIQDDVIRTIEGMIAEIDKRMSQQLDVILHHEDFRRLEGSWRGLHYMVTHTETDETLKIRVMNIGKKDLAKTLKKFKGTAWDQSPIFKAIYEDEYGTPGGEPYGCLVGDYEFDHTPPDVEILKGMGQVAAAAHAPFVAAASPRLMNMDSWKELSNPRDLTKIFQSPEYAPWMSLRKSEDSRYIALTMPRFLSRLPYGSKTNPVETFDYEENTGAADHDRYVWSNSSYAMGTNIMRSFKLYGWCARIRGAESGGMVEGLPCHTFPTDDGGVDMKCPAEIAITDRREAELSANGMLALCHWKNTDNAVFIGAQTLNQPAVYTDKDATANAELSARLPYIFATSRFAHYLKSMVRDKVGSFKERAEMETWLNNWIMRYVTNDPTASEEVKASYPLAAAEVVVEENPENPGYYSAKFFLRPHYQLEGLTASLRLVSKLPSQKAGG